MRTMQKAGKQKGKQGDQSLQLDQSWDVLFPSRTELAFQTIIFN